MKVLTLTALLLASFALAAGAETASSPRVVREFATNTSVADWVLDAGWSWQDGTLTHWAGATGSAQQMSMPALTAGRTYRVDLTFGGRTKGSVALSLGGTTIPGNGAPGTYSFFPTVNDPNALLALAPTSDYDGSVSQIRVVELGDELIDATGWTVPQGWTQENGNFRAAGSPLSLERVVGVVAGNVYRLYFGVTETPSPAAESTVAKVSVGGLGAGWFYQQGNFNYAFDVVAPQDGQLAFTPQGSGFNGAITRISVREITTDPAGTPPSARAKMN